MRKKEEANLALQANIAINGEFGSPFGGRKKLLRLSFILRVAIKSYFHRTFEV